MAYHRPVLASLGPHRGLGDGVARDDQARGGSYRSAYRGPHRGREAIAATHRALTQGIEDFRESIHLASSVRSSDRQSSSSSERKFTEEGRFRTEFMALKFLFRVT